MTEIHDIDILDDDLDENIVYTSEEDDNEENVEVEVDHNEENDEVDEDNEEDVICYPKKNTSKLTPCVVMINRNNTIQRCGEMGGIDKQKKLWNLIGAWEVDTKTVDEKKGNVEELGVCPAHFLYDQNALHRKGLKQTKDCTTGVIRRFRCPLCMKRFRAFCRIYGCDDHCWSFAGKTVQIPCIGQYKCSIVKTFPSVIEKTTSKPQTSYICCACYTSQGGHLHDIQSMGDNDKNCTPIKHAENARETVKILGEWMLNAAETKDDIFNERLSKLAAPMLNVFQEPSAMEIALPSVSQFAVKTILKAKGMLSESSMDVNERTSRKFGKDMAEVIWKSRDKIKKDDLEKPNSLYDYYSVHFRKYPPVFLGLISTLFGS